MPEHAAALPRAASPSAPAAARSPQRAPAATQRPSAGTQLLRRARWPCRRRRRRHRWPALFWLRVAARSTVPLRCDHWALKHTRRLGVGSSAAHDGPPAPCAFQNPYQQRLTRGRQSMRPQRRPAPRPPAAALRCRQLAARVGGDGDGAAADGAAGAPAGAAGAVLAGSPPPTGAGAHKRRRPQARSREPPASHVTHRCKLRMTQRYAIRAHVTAPPSFFFRNPWVR